MRKVKLLALLLSALMVVAVFAGCANTDAIESEVAGLDERVTALEGLLNGINKDIEDTNTKLDDVAGTLENDKTADEIAKLEQAMKDQQAQYEAQLKQQEEANKALNDTLKDLAGAIKDLQDKNTAGDQDAAKLADAIKAKAILVAGLKATYDANKAHYLAADYVEIGKLLETANFEIGAATTTKAVDDLYNGLLKDLEKYDRVDVTTYEYYDALKGNITADSLALAKEANEFLTKTAVPHYAAAPAALTAYVIGVKADGKTPDTINLVALISDLYAKQTGAATTLGTLAEVTASAIALDAKIAKIGTVKLDSATAINALVGEYTQWLARANALSAKNAALVKNSAILTAAQARLLELTNAKVMYRLLGEYNSIAVDYDSVFAPYSKLVTEGTATLFTKQATYNAINAKIAAWVAQYSLEAVNAEAIINEAEGSGFYKNYRLANEKVDALVVKYGTFVSAIVPRIKAMNAIVSLSQEAYTEFAAIDKAIDDWAKKSTSTVDKTVSIELDDANWKKMVNESKILAAAYTENFAAAAANGYVNLYTFANDPELGAKVFFTTTYKAASDAATVINNAIKALSVDGSVDILNFILLENKMKVAADKYSNKSATELAVVDGAVDTIAEFEATYKTDKYDLTGLIHYNTFNEKKDAVVAKIAALKVIAADVTAKYDAIMKALVDAKFTTATEMDEGKVNLNYEAQVNEAYALYEEWLEKGGISTMREFALVKDSTTEYEFKGIITVTVYEGMHDLKTEINDLRKMADDLVKYLTTLDSANTYEAFVAKDLADNPACYNKYTEGTGSSAKTRYKVITGYNAYNTAATADTSGGFSQYAAIQAAKVAYDAFLAANGAQKYAAVETALANYKNSYELIAIKSLAYETVETVKYDDTKGYGKTQADFNTYRASVLAAINSAASKENVRVLIAEFVAATKHNVGALTYAGSVVIKANGVL